MLRLALRNLLAHPARNALTAFSVMVAMALVTFTVAAQARARQMLTLLQGRNNLLVIGTADGMPISSMKQVLSVPGVKRAMYMQVVNGSSRDKRFNFPVHGTTADYMTISDAWFYVPPAEIARWETEKNGALVARQTARDLNLSVGSHATIDSEAGPIDFVVSGISTQGYKNTGVLIHYDYFADLFGDKGKATVFWVELSPDASMKSVGRTIDELYKNTSTPTRSVSASANLRAWSEAGKVIPNLLAGAGLIIILATLLVTANTIAIGIRERTGELATLRAIGFRRGRIVRLLMSEVMLVCLAGGLVGGAVPLLVFREGVELSMGGKLILGKVELPPELLLWVLLASAALALVAGLLPVFRASRLDVATALRAQV